MLLPFQPLCPKDQVQIHSQGFPFRFMLSRPSNTALLSAFCVGPAECLSDLILTPCAQSSPPSVLPEQERSPPSSQLPTGQSSKRLLSFWTCRLHQIIRLHEHSKSTAFQLGALVSLAFHTPLSKHPFPSSIWPSPFLQFDVTTSYSSHDQRKYPLWGS